MVREQSKARQNVQCGETGVWDKVTIKEKSCKREEKQTITASLQSEIPQNSASVERLLQPETKEMIKLVSTKSTDGSPLPKSKKRKADLKCDMCNKTFQDKNSLLEHNTQEHKGIIPYKCKLCKYYTCYSESLFKHCEKFHGLNNVALELYQAKSEIKALDNNPTFEISYLCILCNFKVGTQAGIDEHLSSKHFIEGDNDSYIKKSFNCPSCHNLFSSFKSAKIHHTMYHVRAYKKGQASNSRKFNCDKCGKCFDLKAGLTLHRRICEGREPVSCNFCSLEFTTVLNYEHHLQKKHSVAIKHECEICEKTFTCSEYLTVHRKRHNERSHQCDLCSKNYISNAELKVHKQRMHGNRNNALTALRNYENSAHKTDSHRNKCVDFLAPSGSGLEGQPNKPATCQSPPIFCSDLSQNKEAVDSASLTTAIQPSLLKQSYAQSSWVSAKQYNSMDVPEINDLELASELQEFGLSLEDITSLLSS